MTKQVNFSIETLELMREAVLYRLVALKRANQPPYEHVALDTAAIDAHQEAYELLGDLTEGGAEPTDPRDEEPSHDDTATASNTRRTPRDVIGHAEAQKWDRYIMLHSFDRTVVAYHVPGSLDLLVVIDPGTGYSWELRRFTDSDVDGVAVGRYEAIKDAEGDTVAELLAAIRREETLASERASSEADRIARIKSGDGGWVDRTEEC